MFKSVFAKYITAFMLIIFVSFAMLTVITTVMVNNYSVNEKSDVMQGASESSAEYIEERLKAESSVYFRWFIDENMSDLEPVLRTIAKGAKDVTLIVTDTEGNVLICTGSDSSAVTVGAVIPKSIMDEVNNGRKPGGFQNVEGVFDSPMLMTSVPILNKNYAVGTVFAFSDSAQLDELLEVMIKTFILSSLWVMLAALLAVYIISEKVISPLKSIAVAARKFASGSFDVRVPVKGKDEVAELAAAFNNMAQSLANYENMRNSFMANVSHDLRTPMTTISGFIDGIIAGAIPPEKHEYYLSVIADEVRRLSRLVSSLLDISRLQAGDRKFVMAPFDVCEMARQILISFEQKIDAKGLDVEFECTDDSMFVTADRDAIYQVLYNICDNAIKFSFEKGKLSLSLSYNKEKKVEVSVRNEGMGIQSEDLPYVFERFFKSDKSRGLDKTGVGLGMFITKTIMDAHSEKIWVESEYGKYCRFTLTLTRCDPIADAKRQMPREENLL